MQLSNRILNGPGPGPGWSRVGEGTETVTSAPRGQEWGARRPVSDLDDERRRYYKLTPYGARVASLEAKRLEALLATTAVRTLLRVEGAT